MTKHGPVLPGLENFYMSGVWVTTGGLIRAAAAGRHVMQFICKADQRQFVAFVDDRTPLPIHVNMSSIAMTSPEIACGLSAQGDGSYPTDSGSPSTLGVREFREEVI